MSCCLEVECRPQPHAVAHFLIASDVRVVTFFPNVLSMSVMQTGRHVLSWPVEHGAVRHGGAARAVGVHPHLMLGMMRTVRPRPVIRWSVILPPAIDEPHNARRLGRLAFDPVDFSTRKVVDLDLLSNHDRQQVFCRLKRTRICLPCLADHAFGVGSM